MAASDTAEGYLFVRGSTRLTSPGIDRRSCILNKSGTEEAPKGPILPFCEVAGLLCSKAVSRMDNIFKS